MSGLVLITGAGGQLASALLRSVPDGVVAEGVSRRELDIRDRDAVRALVLERRPAAIINAAAYTAVDQAEREIEPCFAVNREGASHLARAASDVGAFFLQISTDFVFDGAASTPYEPASPPNPLSVYGRSKLEGELMVRSACSDAAILRTAWVYAAEGRNFVLTMLRIMRERDHVSVVSDQVGAPTHVAGLATACWATVTRRASGCWHWTGAGIASWYDFAAAIADMGHSMGLLANQPRVAPIRTLEYPTPARRPPYSVLETRGTVLALGCAQTPWREELRMCLDHVRRARLEVGVVR